jgi:hypothetical protein
MMTYRDAWEPAREFWKCGQNWHAVNWFAFIVIPFMILGAVAVLVIGTVGTLVVGAVTLVGKVTGKGADSDHG